MARKIRTPRKFGAMGVLGAGLATVDGVMTYNSRQAENPDESKLTSLAVAAGTAAAWHFAMPLMLGVTAAQAAGGIGKFVERQNKIAQDQHAARSTPFSQGFRDTELGYTMRQRGVQAIAQSRMNARSALGNEGRLLHH